MHWNLTQTCQFEGRIIKHDAFGTGQPVVVLHGSPWSSFNMRHLIEPLSLKYKVYFYDMVGFGQSDRSDGDVSPQMQAEILDQLLMYWGINNPPIIAHDMGGTVALYTHLILKRDFEKMVLINPIALSPWATPFVQQARQHEAAFAHLPPEYHEALLRKYMSTAAYIPLDDQVLELSLDPWLREGGQQAFYRQMAQCPDACTDDLEQYYSVVRSPVQIIWGLKNPWMSPELGPELNEMILGSTYQGIPGAGHMVMEERPDLLLEKVQAFLDRPVAQNRAA